ncbi:hypothetical protein WR25_24828 [Diploscapter pachys]|uniref:Carboxylic ester hydrolase n=1 Tax=Diploscapter pachys TaxID=2018661 RepID=A0A2A2KK90_9BILA|nr:hypothetical protein WR25_24828 [Diploscapter pachys]
MYNQVETEQGAIKGQVFETDEGIRAEAYKGIPFAEPPVGDLRWRLPVEKKSWRGVRDALNYSSACIQFHDFGYKIKYNQSEDCLYLNVFTPNSSIRDPLLPVLVFIHGGTFVSGSGSDCLNMTTIARNFLDRGIVFVTINYRLGALGFLENQEDELTNFGIWDMIMALKWTKQNIQKFGGNSSQITIMGQSSGAAATSLLALIDQTKDLVSRAIIVSGSFHATWSSLRVGEYGLTSSGLVGYFKCKMLSEYKNESECQVFADCLTLDSPKVVYDKDLVKLSHKELVKKARMPIMIGVMGYEEGRRRHQEFTTKEVIDKITRIESELLFNLACQSEIDAYTSKDLPVYAFSFDYASKGKINFQLKLDDKMENVSFPYSEDKDNLNIHIDDGIGATYDENMKPSCNDGFAQITFPGFLKLISGTLRITAAYDLMHSGQGLLTLKKYSVLIGTVCDNGKSKSSFVENEECEANIVHLLGPDFTQLLDTPGTYDLAALEKSGNFTSNIISFQPLSANSGLKGIINGDCQVILNAQSNGKTVANFKLHGNEKWIYLHDD